MSLIMLVIGAFVALVIIKLSKSYAARKEFFKHIQNIPGPPPLPLLGNGLDFKGTHDVLPGIMKYIEQYGHSFKLFLGPDTYIFTCDPKLIEQLLTSTTQICKSRSYRFLFNWLGTGLLTATNPKWKSHRRIITPTFHFKILDDCIPIFYANTRNLIEHWSKSIGKLVNIHEDVVLCSLDIICETSMGFSINALKEGSSSDYVSSVKFMTKMVVERTFSIWQQFDLLYKNSSVYSREKRAVDFLHSVTNKVIQRKRKEQEEKKTTENKDDIDQLYGKGKFSFIDMLLKCSTEAGGTLSDVDIREEIDTFMFAGHDTISSGLSFTLYLLSMHQDVQEKVYGEVRNVIGADGDSPGIFTMERLNEMKYLEAVIKESMRLYPPVPMIARELTEDFNFNGQVFPKGLTMTMLPYHVHRLTEIYENPDMFDPERFSSENSAKRTTFAYIPFSAGPRNCIGQKFAMLEMKLILSAILLKYKMEPADVPLILVSETVLTSLNGIHVRVEKRRT